MPERKNRPRLGIFNNKRKEIVRRYTQGNYLRTFADKACQDPVDNEEHINDSGEKENENS